MDNAATSWPKPPGVVKAMTHFTESAGGNPGRSGHALSTAAGRIVYSARELVCELFNAPNPLRVIFTSNATTALNIALFGLLRPGDRVVATSMEHNSVMRPLRALETEGVELKIAQCNSDGTLEPKSLRSALSGGAKLVAAVSASNVSGTIANAKGIAEIAHEAGALLLLDAAQSAGAIPIDMQETGVDLLAFTGHKSMLGPQGTGGLVIGESIDTKQMKPLIYGGTGSRSESEYQPEDLPDKFESGTSNGVGIAGLAAGVKYVLETGVETIRAREVEMIDALIRGLSAISGVKVHGTQDASKSVAAISFTIDGKSVSDVGMRLGDEFGIMTRVGLHCAPAAHRTLGTFPNGTVRLAPGIFTTPDEIQQTLRAVETIAET